MLFSLPDNDAYSHRNGPHAQVTSLAAADRQVERLMHAAGGPDQFLRDHAVIVASEAGRFAHRRMTPIGPDGQFGADFKGSGASLRADARHAVAQKESGIWRISDAEVRNRFLVEAALQQIFAGPRSLGTLQAFLEKRRCPLLNVE